MKVDISPDNTVMRITGDYSPHPIHIEAAAVTTLGGSEAAYHEVKRLQNARWLPRMGSAAYPLTDRDLRYAYDNEKRGERYWTWLHLEGVYVRRSIGYDFVQGYGFVTYGVFVFVDAADEPLYRVACGPYVQQPA